MSMEYLTPQAAAELIGVQPTTLSKWRYSGRGPNYVRLAGGNRVRYTRVDIEAFMAEHTFQSTAAESAA